VLIARAYERRPELLALERGILAAEQDVRRTKGQYWPRLAATGQYSQSDGGGSSLMSQDGIQATIGAEIDIFAGGRRKYEVVEARARLDSVRNQSEDVKNLVALDVTRAYIQLQDAAALVLSEQGNVELALEGLRLAELRFQEGVGTQSETLDASLALTGAESALVRALYNYAVAHAALEKAIGDAPMQTTAAAPAVAPAVPPAAPLEASAETVRVQPPEAKPKNETQKRPARTNFTFRKKK
jgi:outer membrane protein TolC